MIYKPNAPFYAEFVTTNPATGSAQDADTLPVAIATKNGFDDSGFVLTVIKLDTGRYKITGVVPSDYVTGDRVQISVAATVADIAGKDVVGNIAIETAYLSDNATNINLIKAKTDNIPTTPLLRDDVRLNHLDADISSRSTFAGGAVASVTAPVVLTSAYDHAKTSAQPSDVADSTAAILAALPAAPDNAGVSFALSILQDATVGLARLDTEIDLITTILGGVAMRSDVALNSDIQILLGRISGAVPQLAAIVTGILDAVAADHDGAGTIGEKINREAAPIVIPLVTGGPTTIELTNQTRINLKRGDTYRLPFSLGRDCAGWSAWFGAKEKSDQTTYDMALRQATYTDQESGTGYVSLSSADTGRSGTFFAELELRRGNERNTPESYTLRVLDDIVRDS